MATRCICTAGVGAPRIEHTAQCIGTAYPPVAAKPPTRDEALRALLILANLATDRPGDTRHLAADKAFAILEACLPALPAPAADAGTCPHGAPPMACHDCPVAPAADDAPRPAIPPADWMAQTIRETAPEVYDEGYQQGANAMHGAYRRAPRPADDEHRDELRRHVERLISGHDGAEHTHDDSIGFGHQDCAACWIRDLRNMLDAVPSGPLCRHGYPRDEHHNADGKCERAAARAARVRRGGEAMSGTLRGLRGVPQTVACPTCEQPAGKPCVNGWGRRCHYAHVARKRLAVSS